MQFLRSVILGMLLLPLAACGPSAQPAKHYQLTGTIVSIDRPTRSLVINADAVPGFMAAMAMPYKVKDASALDNLIPGDSVAAVIVMQNNDYWLENLRVTSTPTDLRFQPQDCTCLPPATPCPISSSSIKVTSTFSSINTAAKFCS